MASPIQSVPPIDSSSLEGRISGASSGPASSFWESLKSALEQVQEVQNEADQKVTDLVTGQGADIHTAMTAVAKADLAFQLVMQVRNKIVAAYQQVSQIQF